MTEPIRVAVVGCGVIGRNHARVIAEHPAFELVAAVDPAAENSARLLAEHGSGAEAYPALPDALAGREADLVVICTPSGTHLDLARQAVAAGKHVVIEKPLDVDVVKGAEFAREAAEAGQVVTVISQHRFDPASAAVADAVRGGRFGKPTSAVASVAWWRDQDYYDSGDWRGTWRLDGGGALMNQGVHTADLLCLFLGRPVEVQASARLLAHERVEVEDTLAATVTFESGAVAVLLATTAAYPGLTARIQIHGTEGSAVIDNDRLEYFHSRQAAGGHRPGGAGSVTGGAVTGNQAEAEVGLAHTPAGPRGEDDFVLGHRRQYDDIAHAISTGAAPGVTIDDALLSLAFVRAIYVSAALGQRVLVADVLAGKHAEVHLDVS